MSELNGRRPDAEGGFTIRSEFGAVRVSKDTTANGDRLKLVGVKTGVIVYLDALELECVANLTPEQLQVIVSPENRL